LAGADGSWHKIVYPTRCIDGLRAVVDMPRRAATVAASMGIGDGVVATLTGGRE
jgi:hypothetical protein